MSKSKRKSATFTPLDEPIRKSILEYIKQNNLTKTGLAKIIGIPSSTFSDILFGKKAKLKSKKKIEKFLSDLKILKVPFISKPLAVKKPAVVKTCLVKEVKERIQSTKLILLLLEKELNWFKDASPNARQILRNSEINTGDLSYITTLITMMFGSEDKLERWKSFTTAKFHEFRKGDKS